MLDVSPRAGVLALPARLARLATERGPGLRYYRDLRSARVVTDELFVLNQARVVEQVQTKDVLQHPRTNTP
jgi:ABC-type microcin C transport system duplicated ATPase subunit YejF